MAKLKDVAWIIIFICLLISFFLVPRFFIAFILATIPVVLLRRCRYVQSVDITMLIFALVGGIGLIYLAITNQSMAAMDYWFYPLLGYILTRDSVK